MDNQLVQEKQFLKRYNLLPSFDEVSIFLMTLAVILVFLTQPTMQDLLIQKVVISVDGKAALMLVLYVCGMIFAIYHAFSLKTKSSTAKFLMLWFAILTNIFIGLYLSITSYHELHGFMKILPILNIADAVWLYLLFRTGILDIDAISDRDATLNEIVFGSIIIYTIFVVSQYIFGNQWPVTISLTTIYATSISHMFQPIFGQSDKIIEKDFLVKKANQQIKSKSIK